MKRRSWGSWTYVLLLASEVRETDIGAIALQVDGCWVRRASEVPEKIQLPWGQRGMINVYGENAHVCVMITGNRNHINKNGPPALGLNSMSYGNCLHNEICQNGWGLVAVTMTVTPDNLYLNLLYSFKRELYTLICVYRSWGGLLRM